jgi:RND family efflux transporter MFP subunit
MKRFEKRIFALTLALALGLSLCACSSSTEEEDTQTETTGVAVQTQLIEQESISSENKVSGKIVADSESTVMVASSAKCTAVYVEAGDVVRAGQKLCTLDLASTIASYNAANISYQSTLQSYENQQSILDKQIALAEDNVNNLKALFEIGAASQLEIDNAELQLEQAKAGRDSTLAQLEAGMQSGISNLEQLQTILENVDSAGNVIAPASGTITSLSAVENGYVSPSVPVAVIDGVDQMKVTVDVSEALVPKLAVGDTADVSVSSLSLTFTGTIRSIDRSASLQTKLYTVTLSIPADVEGLLSGMFADVTFHTDTSQDAVVVPTQAILNSGDTQYVFVVEGNEARYVQIETGLTGNGVTEVTSGLTAGQELVTVGQSYLTDGAAVRVVEQEA